MKEGDLEIIKKFFPEKAVPIIANYYQSMNFSLRFVRPRKSKLGDFRPPRNNTRCMITLNSDLSPYNMTITFIHEIAHYTTFIKHGHKVKPHGDEWQDQYQQLMQPLLNADVFPTPLHEVLTEHLKHVGASAYSDKDLIRALRNYETQPTDCIPLENLPDNSLFKLSDGRIFTKGEKLRTRFKCQCKSSKRWYLVQGLCMVQPLTTAPQQ